MTRASWMVSSLLLLAACAHGAGAERSKSDRDAAQRIYMVAEERYAAGDYAKAVALMRHALLQLPATSDHDALRHELVLRMAHTQLRDHAATGDAAPLHDAQQMLERYAQRHEELFGESKKARAERGDVYELLHLVEQQIEPVTIDLGDEPASPSADATTDLDAVAPAVPEPPAAVPEPTSAELVAVAPALDDDAPAITTKRHTDDDGTEVRDLLVHEQRRLASLDDPRVKERLRSDFSTGWLGGKLTAPGVTKMREARPLVRGFSQLAGDGNLSQQLLARRAGQSLLREARPDLRECYAAAYARQPIGALDSAVEASVHPDGSISHVRIVEGGLVDGYGDACLIEALQGTVLPPLEDTAEPVRVQVALLFFYEGALYINELTGEQVHEGGVMLSPRAPRLQGLPPIEESVSQERNTRRRSRQ
jgi:hypothetical protein